MAGWKRHCGYNGSNHGVHPAVLGLGLAGLALIGGCAGASVMEATSDGGKADESGMVAMEAPRADLAAPTADMEAQRVAEAPPIGDPDVGQAAPQLVKRATLVLTLTDIDGAVAQVQTMIRQAQGDLLSLEDSRRPDGTAHQVYMTLRVPQAQLEPTLAALRQLGTVESQSLSAEDVSSQLVDLSARIKNLRQSEVALQTIMERSGEISHVLEVARELSTVRDSIERLTAQEQNLKRQVAYSTIDLTLQSPITAVPPLRPVSETLGQTWQAATQSVRSFTVGGLKVALWLLAYSPYWVILAAILYGGHRARTRRPDPADPEQPSQS